MDISGDFCNVLAIDRRPTHHSMCIVLIGIWGTMNVK